MKREHTSWKLVAIAAAMALMPVAATWGADAAGPTAADYQNLQQKYQQVQQQLATVSKDVAAIKDTQATLKKQEAAIKKQQAALKKQQAKLKTAQAKVTATSQQATDEAVKHLYNQVLANSQNVAATQSAGSSNTIDETVANLFAPPTKDKYFSPFKDENPDHMRPDMHMQIAQYGNMKLYMGFWTVGRFQALQDYNLDPSSGLNPNFQTPYADLSLLATIPHEFDMFADFYIATPGHPSTTYGDEGWLVFKQLPGISHNSPINELMDYINVKVGAFTIDFGDDNYHRSNNAWVQNNPLIGNPLVDPSTEEIGGEVYSVKGPVYWLFGLSNGSTTGHYDYGAGPESMEKSGAILPRTCGCRPQSITLIWAIRPMYPTCMRPPAAGNRTITSSAPRMMTARSRRRPATAFSPLRAILPMRNGRSKAIATSAGRRMARPIIPASVRHQSVGCMAHPMWCITLIRPCTWRPNTVTPLPERLTA